ncbi:hypothetical protein PF002_g22244 [Phytophthora fragariae]|uniref:Uncharacterized protein n=1 Tax=Phytophthora fragariae TaxID=53985 RepID=A0A6A3XH56_9STRA|nr:hypothetical protein PF002_g22244 [Phytophthora fragariae]
MGCLQDPGGTCSRLFPRAQGVSRAANGFESDSDSEHEHGVRAASGCRVTPACWRHRRSAGQHQVWPLRTTTLQANATLGVRAASGSERQRLVVALPPRIPLGAPLCTSLFPPSPRVEQASRTHSFTPVQLHLQLLPTGLETPATTPSLNSLFRGKQATGNGSVAVTATVAGSTASRQLFQQQQRQ